MRLAQNEACTLHRCFMRYRNLEFCSFQLLDLDALCCHFLSLGPQPLGPAGGGRDRKTLHSGGVFTLLGRGTRIKTRLGAKQGLEG